MRSLTRAIITRREAEELIGDGPPFPPGIDISETDNPIIEKIKSGIEDVIGKVVWEPPSYMRLEHRNRGHEWHVDTGNRGHMPWCNYGCSILLKEDGDVGYIEYRDESRIHNYLDLIIHSSDVEHRVEKNKDRIAFLCFIK